MQQAVVDLPDLRSQARALWQLVERDTGDARLREILAVLYRRAAIPPRDLPALGRAVQRLVQTHITYLREKPETYVAPLRTLSWRVGDCDDQAAALCALLRSAQVPCRLVFVGTDHGRGGPISAGHVYAEAELVPGTWTALETVREVPAGWSAVDHWRSKGWRTGEWRYGDASRMKGLQAG